MIETIPLFPLSTVLFPHGKIPMQVFEPRYLDLVSNCLKHGTGFGVVLLRQGSEVMTRDEQLDTRLYQLGTYATISDWDSLPNGLLGLTIIGEKKFRVISSYQESDNLHKAEIEWIESEPLIALPEQSEELRILLKQLLQHPHLERLNIDADINDVSTLSCLLSQLLPIDEKIKFDLLSMVDPLERLQQLMTILENFSE